MIDIGKYLLRFIIAVTCICSASDLHAQDDYEISGNLKPVLGMYAENAEIDAAYIMSGKKMISEKVPVSPDGNFMISGQIGTPVEASLVVDVIVPGGTGQSSALFVLEKGKIHVEDFLKGHFRGTALNDAVSEEINYLQQSSAASEVKGRHVSSFIERYKHTPAVPIILSRLNSHRLLALKEILDIVNASDPCILENPLVKAYVSGIKNNLSRMQSLESTGEGNMFIDFEVEYEGKVQRLSDYVGRGRYVLADFWASWCRPCRHDIPEVIRLYEKYKDMGLVVLGITVNDKPENSIKAIKDLRIPYPQIMNGRKSVTEPYGIDAIPHVILFAPDGTIIKRSASIKDFEQIIHEIYK